MEIEIVMFVINGSEPSIDSVDFIPSALSMDSCYRKLKQLETINSLYIALLHNYITTSKPYMKSCAH